MARKRLTKGTNALRVEERIARVPADLSSPRAEGSGVFEALRLLERESEGAGGGRDDATMQPIPATPPAARRQKAIPARRRIPAAPKNAPAPAEGPDPKKRLGPESFTKAERRAIVVSCIEYRNRLPTYLKSAMREVEIIDSILQKCERAGEDGAESPKPDGGSSKTVR